MDVNTRNRTELKSYFVKNSIPTESNFAELIDGMLNQRDDGLVKLPDNPLSIEAAGDEAGTKNAINFYRNFGEAQPDWVLSLNPRSKPNDAGTARLGFSISDGQGNSRLFIDRSTGNVGIGTIEPATAKLEVNGSFKATSNASGQGELWMEAPSDGNHRITQAEADQDTYKTGLVYRVKDNPPSGAPIFQVRSSGQAVRLFVDHNGWTGSRDNSAWFGGNKDNYFAGSVGIGTDQPGTKLDVNGTIKATGGLRIDGNLSNHIETDGSFYRYGGQVYITVDDNLYIRDTSGNIGAHFNTNDGALSIGQVNVTGTLQADKYVVQNNVNGGSSKGLWMWNAGDSNWGIYMGQAGNGRSLADGTAVAGAGFSSHAIRFRTYSSAGNGLIYENHNEQLNLSVRASDGLTYIRGNVGIGTTSPEGNLHLHQDRYTLYGPNTTWQAYLQVGGNGRVTTHASVAATNGNLHLDAREGNYATYINFYSKNNTFINAQGGNVGIGTANPRATLEVRKAGASSSPDIIIFGDSHGFASLGAGSTWLGLADQGGNTRLAILQSNGNVGIGTTTPATTLEVNGSFQVKNGNNVFYYNGAADIILKYPPRGSGGRALVHDGGNQLTLNYGNDFNGGVRYFGSLNKASSRDLKENIRGLSDKEAIELLETLTPQKFNLKADEAKSLHLGFIAEDAPVPIATADKKAINTDHIVAVLTSVVKKQQKTISMLTEKIQAWES